MKSESIDLIQITAPSLSDAQYGKSIENVFKSINDNFQKLSNSGFLTGRQGDSVKLQQVKIDSVDNAWYKAIIKAIQIKCPDNELLMSVNGINWYDNILNSTVYVYNAVIDDATNTVRSVGIIPYTLKDARFENIDYANQSIYEQIEEVSCVLYFDGVYYLDNIPKLTCLDVFPTLYYDAESSYFCWKVWGNKTGLAAGGPPGQPGKDGNLIVCVRDENPISGISSASGAAWNIKSIIVNNDEDPVDEKTAKLYNGQLAIVLPSKTEEDKYAGFWISTLNKQNDDKLIAYCGDYNNVLTQLTITPKYFNELIMPNLTEFFLQEDAVTKTRYNLKYNKSDDSSSLELNKTANTNKVAGDMVVKLGVSIEPGIDSSQYSMSVNNDGIYITLKGKKYELSTEDDTSLKLKLIE